MNNNQDLRTAKRLLVHYLRLACKEAGVNWSWDNEGEVEGIVDCIAAGVLAELRKEMQAAAAEVVKIEGCYCFDHIGDNSACPVHGEA